MKYTLGLKGLPFEFDPKQIIYVESEYNEEVNDFIIRYHNDICEYFKLFGYEFCYLPWLHRKFSNDVCKYYDPQDSLIFHWDVESSLLLDYMARPQNRGNIAPSLIYYKENVEVKDDEDIAVRGITIGDIRNHDYDFSDILHEIFEDQSTEIAWSEPRFMIVADKPKESEESDHSTSKGNICCFIDPIPHLEEQFDIETSKLVKEIEERVNKLKQKGISLYVLENILRPPVELSRLVITSDYRIILPDYNNMEIVMTPIVKAVYILFLSHPDGIPFKHLANYRKELLGIYLTIKGENEPTEDILKSISAITDPFNNSINEKCARIREAFVSQFDEHLAKHYFVTGKRGEPKKIALSCDLVKWE